MMRELGAKLVNGVFDGLVSGVENFDEGGDTVDRDVGCFAQLVDFSLAHGVPAGLRVRGPNGGYECRCDKAEKRKAKKTHRARQTQT